MKPFFAIVKLTCRHALRSHLFQLLLLLLALCVAFVPGTVGAGTAADFIRVSLFYSLGAVTFILSLSAMWLGCYVMTYDVDSYQLHLVVTKPVSRLVVWLGKWCGVALVNVVLLVLAAAAVYAIVLFRYNRGDFAEAERVKIRDEVLVGRRVFLPRRPDFEARAREIMRERLEKLRASGKVVDVGPATQEKLLKEAEKEAYSREAEVKHGNRHDWVFDDIPESVSKAPLYFRYRSYVDRVATTGQRMTRVWWLVGVPQLKGNDAAGEAAAAGRAFEVFMLPVSQQPEQVLSGEFHEKTFLPEWKLRTPDGKIYVSLVNFDYSESNQYYQVADGPKLLVRTASFLENYLRAVLVMAIGILIVSGFGCAFGGFLTLPTAVFAAAGYLLFGSFSLFMVGQDYIKGAADEFGLSLAKLLLMVVVPLQAFDVTDRIAGGELIEWSWIGRLTWEYLILRAVPIFVFGIWLYRRRELGLVIRK